MVQQGNKLKVSTTQVVRLGCDELLYKLLSCGKNRRVKQIRRKYYLERVVNQSRRVPNKANVESQPRRRRSYSRTMEHNYEERLCTSAYCAAVDGLQLVGTWQRL